MEMYFKKPINRHLSSGAIQMDVTAKKSLSNQYMSHFYRISFYVAIYYLVLNARRIKNLLPHVYGLAVEFSNTPFE